jgi:hypothetical protein
MMKTISGGVCAAKGFTASGVHCGIRKNRTKKDIALIFSETRATAAAVYTTNLVKGAPLTVTKSHIADGYAQAVICNSGNANTCNANGIEIAEQMSALCAAELGISADNSGIMDLPEDLTVGTDIKDIYPIDDIIFEVDNKSLTNRPDLWGHYGIAREFAALAGRQLLPVPKKDLSAYHHLPEVEIDVRDTEHCYRYIGVKVEGPYKAETYRY